jgi:glycerol-3-phosphate dehydrogenase
VGTWHDDTEADPVRAEATTDDLERFIADANVAFPWLALRPEEATLVHRGVVPAVRAANNRVTMRTHSVVVDHTRDGVEGIVSVIGVKYTTGRSVAEQSVDAIVRKLGRRADSCATNRAALPGAARDLAAVTNAVQALLPSGDPETAAHLAASYGTTAVRVLEPAKARPELFNRISPRHVAVAAEVVFSIRQEMAQTLIDVVARRIDIGTSGHPGEQAARAAAAVAADEAGWSEVRVERELEALRRFYLPIDTNPA